VHVRTFLIADVRGYTRYTHEQGDEQAGMLAAAFAGLAREAVVSHGGELLELRGDEALAVFASARQGVRAAVELQRRFRARDAEGTPVFPLAIGIGLDAGEAVAIERGYRGGALNLAARLCNVAAPGQILASHTVASLAGRTDGVRFVDRRPVRLKGIEKPVRVIELVPDPPLPPLPEIHARKRPRVTRRRAAAVAIAGVAVVAALVVFAVTRSTGTHFLGRVDANAIGLIDADAARIKAQVPLLNRPSAVAAGGGFVWVASEEDGTVSRIDPGTRAVQSVSVGASAAGVAYGAGSVWVTNSAERVVVQIDPRTLRVVQTIAVGNGPGAVAAGYGAVWVANTIDGTVSRIDLAGGGATKAIPVGSAPAGIALGAGAVWVSSETGGTLLQLDPRSGAPIDSVPVGNGPSGVAVGKGGVWVANSQDGTVSHLDPRANSVVDTIDVGRSPVSVAAGQGMVWVANEGDGTIARLDPGRGEVDKSLSFASSPNALVVAGNTVWASTRPAVSSHRGGVLRVESDLSQCRCVDPAFGTGPTASFTDQNVSTLAYDGLVAYRRVGGIGGGTLVGNLAVRVPRPTDQGRTYTFQLRRGIRYSNGATVRASDFRYSLERLLTINRQFASGYYNGIVGASKCSARPPARCDLSRESRSTTQRAGLRSTSPRPTPISSTRSPCRWRRSSPAGHPFARRATRPFPAPARTGSRSSSRTAPCASSATRTSASGRPTGTPTAIRTRSASAKSTVPTPTISQRAARPSRAATPTGFNSPGCRASS
jgi:YVTN family beta-propeller protein